MTLRIVYANLGYSRDINGSIVHHVSRLHHHIYTPVSAQMRSLGFVKETLRGLKPDLSCFVEVDQGSLTNGFLDQLPHLREEHHTHVQVDSKYAKEKRFGKMSISRGKSNAFLATRPIDFQSRYLDHGRKRLVYDIEIDGIRVMIAHCSLSHQTRVQQFEQLAAWIGEREGPTVLMGDFNIFRGPSELRPLLRSGMLFHLNRSMGPTFRLGPYRANLDTCLVSMDIAARCDLKIIEQPVSDHHMLRLDIRAASESEVPAAAA